MRAAILLALCVMFAAPGAAQEGIDFSDIGMYGQDFPLLDFTCLKFLAPRDAEYYERCAERVRAAHERGQFVLVCIYTFDRVTLSRPIEEYIANTDELLQNLPLELIDIICLGEENIAWNNGLEVQNRLYDHVKRTYPGTTVYQWFTPYDVPHAKVRTDGWIIDLYRLDYQEYRRFVQKYIATGKPLIACINASPEIKPWSSSQDQVDICREFNVPMFFYAVDGIEGSPYIWMDSDDPTLARWRGWFMRVREMAHGTDTSLLPQASAQWSYGQPVEVAGDAQNGFEYADSFATQMFIDDATIDGFLGLRWDGWAERLGLVGDSEARLTYHLWSAFPIEQAQADASFVPVDGAQASLSAEWSADGHSWQAMALGVPLADFAGQNLWVRLNLQTRGGSADEPAAWLDDLSISGVTIPPEERVVHITPLHRNGRFEWRDDFQSTRSMHLAKIDGGEHLQWERGRVWIRGGQGRVASTLRWHFVAERPVRDVTIAIEGYAHQQLSARNEIAVSLDGEQPIITRTTSGLEDASGRYTGTIEIDLSEDERFEGATEFWVHVTMINTAGTPTNRSNEIRALEVTGVVVRED